MHESTKMMAGFKQTSSSSSQQYISLYIGGKIEVLSGKPQLAQIL